jgi:hypothetical protein
MANTKPFVAVACFCENLLEESDGVLSAIRIVDTYHVQVPPNLPENTLPVIEMKGLVSLKSGDLTGSYTVGLVMENSLGQRTQLSPEGGWPVVFNGGEHGVTLKIRFPLGVKNLGLCWFDVLFGDEVLTRIPLRLRQAEESAATSTPS